MPVSGSNHPLFRAIEWKQHRFSQSNRDAISSCGVETGRFRPHSGAKLLLTRRASATETKESVGQPGTDFDVPMEPVNVARDIGETTCERSRKPLTVSTFFA